MWPPIYSKGIYSVLLINKPFSFCLHDTFIATVVLVAFSGQKYFVCNECISFSISSSQTQTAEMDAKKGQS